MSKRWIQYWQRLPLSNQVGAVMCAGILMVCVIVQASLISGLVTDWSEDADREADIGEVEPVQADAPTPPDADVVRVEVWSKVLPALDEANRKAAKALDNHLASIIAFIDEHKGGSKAFAERLLSLKGKYKLLKGKIFNESEYAEFLQETFNEHLFPMQELEKVVALAVKNYLLELDSINDELLVRLRADVGDDEIVQTVIPALRSDQAFRTHYEDLSKHVVKDLHTDLAVFAGSNLFLWPASTIATELTLSIGTAVASRLGVSGTILGTGAALSWRTLGVGLVVAIVLDAVVSKIIKVAGYDAEAKIAEQVSQTLADLGRTITDGDPQARERLETLKLTEAFGLGAEERSSAADAIRKRESGIQLHGLRRELSKISAARASMRKETLRRLVRQE